MQKSIFTFIVIFYSLIFISCSQKLNNSPDKKDLKNNTENYTKDISDPTNTLSGIVQQMEVEFTVWGCACPNWIETKENQNNERVKNYLSLHFYIEAAHDSLKLPDYFDASSHKLIISGEFYEREDYPKGTVESEEFLPKAKVFRYTELEVLEKL